MFKKKNGQPQLCTLNDTIFDRRYMVTSTLFHDEFRRMNFAPGGPMRSMRSPREMTIGTEWRWYCTHMYCILAVTVVPSAVVPSACFMMNFAEEMINWETSFHCNSSHKVTARRHLERMPSIAQAGGATTQLQAGQCGQCGHPVLALWGWWSGTNTRVPPHWYASTTDPPRNGCRTLKTFGTDAQHCKYLGAVAYTPRLTVGLQRRI